MLFPHHRTHAAVAPPTHDAASFVTRKQKALAGLSVLRRDDGFIPQAGASDRWNRVLYPQDYNVPPAVRAVQPPAANREFSLYRVSPQLIGLELAPDQSKEVMPQEDLIGRQYSLWRD